MATRRTKNGDEEKLDTATLERVIKLLEPTEEGVKPITKKDACSILNIAYNTTRLGKLIEVFKEKKAREAAQRAAKRGKPASPEEIKLVIEGYLEGESIDSISNLIYRSSSFVNGILERYGVPLRQRAHSYFRPELIPEAAVRDAFAIGETVYSARYDSIARIEKEVMHGSGQRVYRIWLLHERWKEYAYQEACELASLEHLKELGVKV